MSSPGLLTLWPLSSMNHSEKQCCKELMWGPSCPWSSCVAQADLEHPVSTRLNLNSVWGPDKITAHCNTGRPWTHYATQAGLDLTVRPWPILNTLCGPGWPWALCATQTGLKLTVWSECFRYLLFCLPSQGVKDLNQLTWLVLYSEHFYEIFSL
jgi:hypothetical protein